MEAFLSAVSSVNDAINGVVWGPIMLVLLVGTGIMFTVRSKVFQISKIGLWLKSTFISIFKRKDVRKTKDGHAISQFQSLCTALASTIGTGNIAGVATAIAAGGPGAVFWMWISAFFGMMTSFAEKVLGIKYRYKNENGNWVGGAMIYIERGLKWKWLAIVFSIFCVLASFGIGNLSQANSIAGALKNTFGINTEVTGLFLSLIVGLVIIGGIKRIAKVAEAVVPFMALFYIAGSLIVICCNGARVPAAFGMIFEQAFNFQAAAGGVIGYGVATAMRMGIARGVFSNEAGLGSSVMAHSASDVKEPVEQGMWGIFEVFTDTIIVCSMTALTILSSGVYDMNTYAAAVGTDAFSSLANGAVLTSNAFATVFGPFGSIFVSIALTLFASTTILGWSYYGERGVSYLFGTKAVPSYKIIFIVIVTAGASMDLSLVWGISDTFNGLMAIPNLIALVGLSGVVMNELKSYLKRRKAGLLGVPAE